MSVTFIERTKSMITLIVIGAIVIKEAINQAFAEEVQT